MPHRAPATSSRRNAKKGAPDDEPVADLWDQYDERGNAFATNKPQPVRTSELWEIPAESTFQPRDGPRRRAALFQKPNNRPAVPEPHPGQSFNPEVEEHQQALQRAVVKLEKQKSAHQQFAKWLGQGTGQETTNGAGNDGKSKHGGGMQADRVQSIPQAKPAQRKRHRADGDDDDPEEEGEEQEKGPEGEGTTDEEEDGDLAPNPSVPKKLGRRGIPDPSKKPKLAERQATNRTRVHRRHPSRDVVSAEIDAELPKLVTAMEEEKAARRERLARRIATRRERLVTRKIGRHVYHPLPLDVQPTKDLVGSLRHVKGGAIHPVQERIKSLEERNLIPARVRHTYHRRKVLKAKGEVMIRREPFGILPDTNERH